MSWLRIACPALFVVFALATSLFLAWNLPPFMAADEGAHLHRANLFTHGRLVGERLESPGTPPMAGGPVDWSLFAAAAPFDDEIGRPDNKTDASDFATGGTARWDGNVSPGAFTGSAPYPPFFYVPAGIGLWLGKALDAPVLQSVYLARGVNALACAVIGFAALCLAGRVRIALFALLLLPMSTALFGAPTQDGMAIVTAALAAALIARAMGEGRPMRPWELYAAAVCIALLGMSKPPFVFLALILLAAPVESRRQRWIAGFVAVVPAVLWSVWSAHAIQVPLVRPDMVADPGAQFRRLLADPALVLQIAPRTLALQGEFLWRSFLGVLGWLDTPLPARYYTAAGVMLALAFVAAWSLSAGGEWRLAKSATIVAVVLVSGAIFGAMFLIWTPVGGMSVEGVQGRYFLPLAVFLPLLIAGERPLFWPPSGRLAEGGLAALVLAFPLVSLIVVARAVILRYYLD